MAARRRRSRSCPALPPSTPVRPSGKAAQGTRARRPITGGRPAAAAGGPTQAFSLTITAPTIAVAPGTLPGGVKNIAYIPNTTLTATGGTAPYTFMVTTGTLPPGLNLASNGTLTGTPTATGAF